MESRCRLIGRAEFPPFTGKRIMMMPFVIGATLPREVDPYRLMVDILTPRIDRQHHGRVGYLTIDERELQAGETHRRPGLHVDGVYRGGAGGWGGGGGPWGCNGMLLVASHPGCVAYQQSFDGEPGPEGECDHMAAQCSEPTHLQAGDVWWLDGHCVHESVPQPKAVKRQMLRLSLPSRAPWFDGYTPSPLGVMPTGPILPRRVFMEGASNEQ